MSSPVGMGDPRVLLTDDLSRESVVVTHVENPEKFFCRLDGDDQRWRALNDLVKDQVSGTPAALISPDIPVVDELDVEDHLLAYSTIHQQWCRCRVQLVMRESAPTVRNSPVPSGVGRLPSPVGCHVSVRVLLIDFGSVEVVSLTNLRQTTDEIVGYNNGQSFCFECRISQVKPYAESDHWSSYANYLFEKCTKDKVMQLQFDRYDPNRVVVCDLRSYGSSKDLLHSMADYLVATRVANYRMGEDFYHRLFRNDGPDYDHKNPNPRDFEWHSDDEEELNTEDKLYYL